MTEAAVVSRNFSCKFGVPFEANVVEEEMGRILLDLGKKINYKGKIIGHLKAIAVSEENFLQMSLTSLPKITAKASPVWNEKVYREIELTINLIVFGYEKNELENFLQETLSGSKLLMSSRRQC